MPIATGAVIGGALIGGGLRLASTIAGNRARQKEQKRIEAREDTAVQRRVADLQAAGLSPTLAAGSAATTAAPPQIENPDLEGFDPERLIALKQGMADVGRTEADTQLAHIMAREHGFAADLKEQEYLHKIVENPMLLDQMRADLAGTNLTNEAKRLENEITRNHGQDAARLRNEAMTIANEIARTHGMNEAEARVIGLRIANDQAAHDLQKWREIGYPSGVGLDAKDRLGKQFADMFSFFGSRSSTRRNTRSERVPGGRY